MTVVWHYVLPMLLGRTYDMRTDRPGVDIFPQTAINSATKIESYFSDSQYKMISETEEARDFLDVSGDLSLKIKAGSVDIQGLGKYVKESISRTNMVEILVKVHYETVTFTLPSTAEPSQGWQEFALDDVGTHYVRSITYGGDLVASLRFHAKSTADVETIKGIIQGNLQSGSGSFGFGIAGNLSKLQEDLKDTSSLEINYYATVPITGVPNTLDSLMELVDIFPSETRKVNNGIGVPLRMELFPLSALDSKVSRYLETKALVDVLNAVEAQFDDIRATKTALREWLLNVPPLLSQKHEDELGEFNDKLEQIGLEFYRILGKMDLSENADASQFDEAFSKYEDGETKLPDKYFRKFLVLRDKIIQESPDLRLDVGGTTYVQWGRKKCTSPGSESLYTGIITATDKIKGGSAEIICLTSDAKGSPDTDSVKRDPRLYSKLAPLYFTGRENIDKSLISCSLCYVENRTASIMLPAKTTCPDKWTTEYKGFLVTKDVKSRKGDYICVYEEAEILDQQVLKNLRFEESNQMADVKVSCGMLPCEKYTKDSLVPCVMCTY